MSVILLTALFSFYLFKTSYYLPAYKNMESYIDFNLWDYPDQFTAWNFKGVMEHRKGRLFSSLHYWTLGLRHNPTDFRLNFNIAQCFRALGQLETAAAFMATAAQGLPQEAIDKIADTMRLHEAGLLRRAGMAPVDWGKNKVVQGDRKIILPGE